MPDTVVHLASTLDAARSVVPGMVLRPWPGAAPALLAARTIGGWLARTREQASLARERRLRANAEVVQGA